MGYKKLDRMMAPETKERRYIPDDPYEKYNKMSFLKHKYSLEKNKKLIEEHGNKTHKFDRYRMHRDRLSHYNDLPKDDNVYHEPEWMAPHFQRTPIKEPDFIIEKK